MRLVWKLLRRHVSWPQLAGFFLANLFGMIIVLVSVQFYRDVIPLFSGEDGLMKKDFLVVTKQVSTLGSLLGGSSTFSAGEIDEIRRQEFVRDAGTFTPSAYQVTGGVSMEKLGIGISTEMFFESVPDRYIDADLSTWKFNENEGLIPIIVPRNYLNLYNFGFARSRNLPAFSEGMVGMVDLNVRLYGNGRRENFKGKIVGFSDRLNTILVPEDFMKWANRMFAEGSVPEPSRLIVEVSNPADKAVSRFFQSKGYQVEDGKLDSGKAAWFLQLITSLVAVVGLLICGLAFYILTLSIYLILQKNTAKLENLRLLGYSSGQLARPYQWLALGLNGGVLLLAVIAVAVVRGKYLTILSELGNSIGDEGLVPALICGLGLFLFVSLFNIWIIRRKIRAII